MHLIINHYFSTGMKAKLKVLTTIFHGASLLILDEPTSGLDVGAREEILDVLRGYMEEDGNSHRKKYHR